MHSGTPLHLTWRQRLGTLALGYPVVAIVYLAVGRTTATWAERTVRIPLDLLVPFDPRWVIVYALIFVQAVAPASVISDRRVLERSLIGFVAMYAVAVPIWLAFPVTVPRMPLVVDDVWTYGLALIRHLDPPTNCMPSMHVAQAAFAALIVWRHDRPVGLAMGLSTLGIWYSTMALDQHWALDGLAGLGIALLADHLAFGLRPLPAACFVPIDRRWHLVWVLVFVVGVLVMMSGWWLGWMPPQLLQAPTASW